MSDKHLLLTTSILSTVTAGIVAAISIISFVHGQTSDGFSFGAEAMLFVVLSILNWRWALK